jgi:hypothetical protein
MIVFEKQTRIWKEEFFECWKLQELYGDEIPINLWSKLFEKAKNE